MSFDGNTSLDDKLDQRYKLEACSLRAIVFMMSSEETAKRRKDIRLSLTELFLGNQRRKKSNRRTMEKFRKQTFLLKRG